MKSTNKKSTLKLIYKVKNILIPKFSKLTIKACFYQNFLFYKVRIVYFEIIFNY